MEWVLAGQGQISGVHGPFEYFLNERVSVEGFALRADLAGLGFKSRSASVQWKDCKEAKTEARILVWRLSKKSRKVMVSG